MNNFTIVMFLIEKPSKVFIIFMKKVHLSNMENQDGNGSKYGRNRRKYAEHSRGRYPGTSLEKLQRISMLVMELCGKF